MILTRHREKLMTLARNLEDLMTLARNLEDLMTLTRHLQELMTLAWSPVSSMRDEYLNFYLSQVFELLCQGQLLL